MTLWARKRSHSNSLQAGQARDRILVGGGGISAPVQTGPGAHPAFYTMGTWSFLGVKQLGRGVVHPPPSSTKVKERVELYLFSPSGPSWPVIGWTLPVPWRWCSTVVKPLTLPCHTSVLMSCRREPSGFSRQNRRLLCTVNSRGNCSCSERPTSLPSLCLHTVRKKEVHSDKEIKLALVPFLTWCHYGQHSSVYEVSWQYDYLPWSSHRQYFRLQFEETSPIWEFHEKWKELQKYNFIVI